MANVRLALEQSTYEIDSVEELIQLAQSGALKAMTLLLECHIDYDVISLQGPGPWSLNPRVFNRADIVYIIFATMASHVGFNIHFT